LNERPKDLNNFGKSFKAIINRCKGELKAYRKSKPSSELGIASGIPDNNLFDHDTFFVSHNPNTFIGNHTKCTSDDISNIINVAKAPVTTDHDKVKKSEVTLEKAIYFMRKKRLAIMVPSAYFLDPMTEITAGRVK